MDWLTLGVRLIQFASGRRSRFDDGTECKTTLEDGPMAGANVHEFTDNNFKSEVLDSAQPVLVDFWAPWCGPCRQIAPMIEQLAAENLGTVKVGKVNIDESPRVSQEFGVEAIPTLLIFKGGQVVSRSVGAQPKARMQSAIDAVKG
jgi:thioredoxin 1